MKDDTKHILKYTLAALAWVLLSGLLAYVLTSDNDVGNMIRFAVPVVAGVFAAVYIHFRFRDILNFEEKLEDDE